MSKARLRRIGRKLAACQRRRMHPVLARALQNLSDREIDAALHAAGLTRARLFTSRDAIAQHRVRMAHMLSALDIDVRDAATRHWDALKQADKTCSMCTQSGRCRRWLQWGKLNEAPRVFCPNSEFFLQIIAQQASQNLGRYLV